MAVANKQRGREPKPYKLILEDEQEVNVMAVRGGQAVGSERELQRVRRELTVIQERTEYLTKEAVTAADDKTYRSKLNYVKKYEENGLNDLELQVDITLLAVLTKWDLALTEEDETACEFVPLTKEGLATVERNMKLDIFSKLMEKFGEETEEKKALSGNLPDGTAVKASSVSAPTGSAITN